MCGRFLLQNMAYEGLIVREVKGHRFFPINSKIVRINGRIKYLPSGRSSFIHNEKRYFCPDNLVKTDDFIASFAKLTANLFVTGATIVEFYRGDCQSIPLRVGQLDAQNNLPGVKERIQQIKKAA